MCYDALELLISIHALREEGDLPDKFNCRNQRRFLSTPSARRATRTRRWDGITQNYFYPRPPRGGRPSPSQDRRGTTQNFYPRPPRGGRHELPFPL